MSANTPAIGPQRERILSPKKEQTEIDLAQLIDVPALQGIMEDFHVLSRFPMALIDLHGKVLVGVGWQRICTHFHRTHPDICKHCMESDTELTTKAPPGEFRLYRCKNGLWDCATPLMLGGRHVGNLFTGQFFLDQETVDREFFRAQARRYGLDEAAYLAALDAVPHMARDMVNTCMAFLVKLSQSLSQLSYSNIKLARLLAERNEAQHESATAGDFLKSINLSTNTRGLVHASLTFFHRQSGCEAVGLRLKKGDDYLGFEVRGFPEEFVQLENSPFDRCSWQGYESVALIALRVGDNRLGLLRLSDPRPGLFTA
jgi:ligand-binding sensor protein